MQNLRYSANKGSDDAYDVSTSLTGYEPNFMAFSELNDSSVQLLFSDWGRCTSSEAVHAPKAGSASLFGCASLALCLFEAAHCVGYDFVHSLFGDEVREVLVTLGWLGSFSRSYPPTSSCRVAFCCISLFQLILMTPPHHTTSHASSLFYHHAPVDEKNTLRNHDDHLPFVDGRRR